MRSGFRPLIPDALARRVRKAARRSRLPADAWVRQAIERALTRDLPADDPLGILGRLEAPTADIDRMLAETTGNRE